MKTPPRLSAETLGRFFAQVVVDPSGCWLWTGARNGKGYAAFSSFGAHRVSYAWFVGAIPAKFEVHHACQVPTCVNPAHLEALSSRDHHHKGSYWWLENKCKHGHALTEENTCRYTVHGIEYRCCRTCRQASRQRYRDRQMRRRWTPAMTAHLGRRSA